MNLFWSITRHGLALVAVAITVLFSSCFTSYQVESDKKVSGNDAHLILYRKGIMGFAVGTKIYANGNFVGKVGPNRYISCWLPEGEYLMSIRTTKLDEMFFKVNMKAGKTYAYYFAYSMRPRDNGRPMPHKMDDISVISRRRPPLVNYFN